MKTRLWLIYLNGSPYELRLVRLHAVASYLEILGELNPTTAR